jgi:hypothetical protein
VEGGSPNAFAYFALFAFIPFGIGLFFALRPALAAIVLFLAEFMFLPELVELSIPGLPVINKQAIAGIACFLGILLRARGKLFAAKPFRGPDIFFLLGFVGNFGTSFTNTDVITHGPSVLPALSAHEAFNVCLNDLFYLWLPFVIGRALITTSRDVRQLLQSLAIAGAIYTPFEFIELMLSPQLHMWIYGFHQHEFLQTIRGNGYRPMVFMPHGLVVGLFMCWSALAAVVLFKARKKILGFPSFAVAGYNFAFLVWCKSLGAVVYTLVMAPIIWFTRPKGLVRVCAILAAIVFVYPVLRATDLFPTKGFVDAAYSIAGGDRAQSLQFRFEMEQLLTDHTKDRPLFGWGRFQRNMVLDDYTGRDVSVSDGQWIVMYSQKGAWGFVCFFGIVLTPIFYLRRKLPKIEDREEKILLAGLAALLAVGVVDLVPNALQNSFTVFIAGALWGATRAMSKPGRADEGAAEAESSTVQHAVVT